VSYYDPTTNTWVRDGEPPFVTPHENPLRDQVAARFAALRRLTDEVVRERGYATGVDIGEFLAVRRPWTKPWLIAMAAYAVEVPIDGGGVIDVDSPSPGLAVIYVQINPTFEEALMLEKAQRLVRRVEERLPVDERPLGLTLRVLASPCIAHRGTGPDDPNECASNLVLGLACARGAKP